VYGSQVHVLAVLQHFDYIGRLWKGSFVGMLQNQATHVSECIAGSRLDSHGLRMFLHGGNNLLHACSVGHRHEIARRFIAQVTQCQTAAFLEASIGREALHGSDNCGNTLSASNHHAVVGIARPLRQNTALRVWCLYCSLAGATCSCSCCSQRDTISAMISLTVPPPERFIIMYIVFLLL